MIQRDRPEGSDVWFNAENGPVRRGQLVRMTDTQVCLQLGAALIIVPRRNCYADKEAAVSIRATELGNHIGAMIDVHRELLKQLDPRPCRVADVCFAGSADCSHCGGR